jgi:hypothetical protein
MSASYMPGLPTLTKLKEKSYFLQALRVCRNQCSSRRKPSCHVKASTSCTLASTGICLGCCKKCRVCTILWKFIPQFELQIAPLCDLITKLEYTKPVAPHWTTAAQDSFNDIKQAILSDPCLKRFDHNRLIVLRSDFSSKGFGYVICQPGNNNASTTAMNAYCSGSDFSFMTKDSTAVLHPVAFGARRCRGNEVRLHSHLGEGFFGEWAMNKCRHMLFGQRFVWTTDCYAIKFILSYDSANPAILRLQMCLMCWDVGIVH